MGTKYLIDTNTLIDAQTRKLSEKGLFFLTNVMNENFIVSFITYIEFLGYKNITESTQNFIALAEVIEMNTTIIDICISIRKSRAIKLPDAIIAATALAFDYTLITNNTKDFENITNLKVVNPMKL